jgi:hypothetical protein
MSKTVIRLLYILFISIFFSACQNNDSTTTATISKKKEPRIRRSLPAFTYSLVKTKTWLQLNDQLQNDQNMNILMAINRTDNANLKNIDSMLVPSSFVGDIEFYLPFPLMLPELNEINKVILFSYSTQSFAAYENGELAYSGPTSMGRKKDPTPTGLFFCNWKAEQTTSTFNDEWDLKWNFNIENKEGIGFHEYALPGFPASHSCLRLNERDAKYLYSWADEWELKGTDNILAQGTPIIVFGTYDFDAPKPWLKLAANPTVLNISPEMISQIVSPFKEAILLAQKKRAMYFSTASKN